MRILARPLVSSGVFYFQAPGSLRWEYREPIRNILLMHKGNTRRYVQDERGLLAEQGAPLQAMPIVLEQIAGWLNGRFEDNPLFSATLSAGRGIVLVPKEEALARMIQKIELTLSDQPGVVESVTIFESDDSFTRMVFRNAVLNRALDDSLFQMTP